MTADQLHPVDPEEPQDIEVDVDLDLISEVLRREAVGEATTVRLSGKVIHVLHAGDWPTSAMRAASSGDWDTWARAVIQDNEEFATWVDADLANFQIEAVFSECGRQARMSMGKSRNPSGSSRRSRRR
jgi:hypothetical protein